MALQINIVNGHEELLSPFVGDFEFAYIYVGSELLLRITWNLKCS